MMAESNLGHHPLLLAVLDYLNFGNQLKFWGK